MKPTEIDKKPVNDILYDQREKLRVILDSIRDGVIVMDNQRRIALVNRTTEELTGYSKRDLLGKNYSHIIRLLPFNKDRARYIKLIADIYESGIESDLQNLAYVINKIGQQTSVTFSASPIKNSNDRVIGAVIIFRDTTKELEVDRMKTEFVSVASHQLRTPLTGIKWSLELLAANEEKNLNEEQLSLLTSIGESTDRMIQLVNDLLDVSRIDNGDKFILNLSINDIVPVIKNVIEGQQSFAIQKKVTIVSNINQFDSLRLNVDPGKIFQALHNLLNNAIKYSHNGSEVSVNVLKSEGSILVTVSDHGVGIPLEEQDKIFTKFFRAGNVSGGGYDGNGLGLYIVKAIIEAHNGSLSFVSSQGEGTQFLVKLPEMKSE